MSGNLRALRWALQRYNTDRKPDSSMRRFWPDSDFSERYPLHIKLRNIVPVAKTIYEIWKFNRPDAKAYEKEKKKFKAWIKRSKQPFVEPLRSKSTEDLKTIFRDLRDLRTMHEALTIGLAAMVPGIGPFLASDLANEFEKRIKEKENPRGN